MTDTPIINLQDAKATRARKKYASMVLKAWDDQEHAARRVILDRATEVNMKAKEQL